MLQVLSMILISVGYVEISDFLVIGKPKLEMAQVTVQLISLYILLPMGFYFYGMKGSCLGNSFVFACAINLFPYSDEKIFICSY